MYCCSLLPECPPDKTSTPRAVQCTDENTWGGFFLLCLVVLCVLCAAASTRSRPKEWHNLESATLGTCLQSTWRRVSTCLQSTWDCLSNTVQRSRYSLELVNADDPELATGEQHSNADRSLEASGLLDTSVPTTMERKDIDGLSVAQLRECIVANGLSHADCLEKDDLRERAWEAMQQANLAVATSVPTNRHMRKKQKKQMQAEDAIRVGDKVIWTLSDQDVPAGTVGVVQRPLQTTDANRVPVAFPSGTYDMKWSQLKRADNHRSAENRRQQDKQEQKRQQKQQQKLQQKQQQQQQQKQQQQQRRRQRHTPTQKEIEQRKMQRQENQTMQAQEQRRKGAARKAARQIQEAEDRQRKANEREASQRRKRQQREEQQKKQAQEQQRRQQKKRAQEQQRRQQKQQR
eukprot:COSAG02_NODE_11497_length_1712_cov_44.106014_1_plen_403_part_01